MNRNTFIQKINRTFELLGNPLRLKIFLKILSEGCDCDINSQSGYTGNCVTGIMKDLKLPQSTVSSYIKDLQNAQIIDCSKNGKYLYCRPNKETIIDLKSFIDSALSQIKY
jgi:DNA-binding transcriptional ArsR family regulator